MPHAFIRSNRAFLFQTPFSKNKITDEADGKIPKWSASSVRHILTNPVYTGTLIQGTTKKESAKSKKRIKPSSTEWIIYPNAHPALISEDISARFPHYYRNGERKNKKKCNSLRLWRIRYTVNDFGGISYEWFGSNKLRRMHTDNYFWRMQLHVDHPYPVILWWME